MVRVVRFVIYHYVSVHYVLFPIILNVVETDEVYGVLPGAIVVCTFGKEAQFIGE